MADRTHDELRELVITADEYWAKVDEAADYVVEQFEDQIHEYVRSGETPDDMDEKLLEARLKACQFHVDHPHMLGFQQANYIYLGALLHHSDSSGWSGYYSFVRNDAVWGVKDRSSGPVNAHEATGMGALFAMQRDVRDECKERWSDLRVEKAIELRKEGKEVGAKLQADERKAVEKALSATGNHPI